MFLKCEDLVGPKRCWQKPVCKTLDHPVCAGAGDWIENLPVRYFNLIDFIQQIFTDGLPCGTLMPDRPWSSHSPCSSSLDAVRIEVCLETWQRRAGSKEVEGRGSHRTREAYAKSWGKNGCLPGRQAGKVLHEKRTCALPSELMWC